MEMAEKMAKFGPKTLFLAISGPRGPRGMVKVEQMVDHSKTCLMRNSPEKCTQWCGNGPKVAHLRQKKVIFGPKWATLEPFPHHWVHFSDKLCT